MDSYLHAWKHLSRLSAFDININGAAHSADGESVH